METQSHWFFGTMSPDITASFFSIDAGAFLAGVAGFAFAVLWVSMAGGSRK